jgi:DnaJ-class molecular chaperone
MKCGKCNGTGKILDWWPLVGVPGATFQEQDCDRCKGTGEERR